MHESEIPAPSSEDYLRALHAVKNQITANQRKMLEFHHAQPARAVSATTLARHVGWPNHVSANLQYGKLSNLVVHELGLPLKDETQVGVLVEFVYPGQAGNNEFLWIMRERVALALETLGWVPSVSQYLYPDLALERRQREANKEPGHHKGFPVAD